MLARKSVLVLLAVLGLASAARAGAQNPVTRAVGAGRPVALEPQYVYGDDERVKISVNVWGEVERPGSYLIPDDTDLITLLSLAGGPTSSANLGAVKLVRFRAAHPTAQHLNLDRILASPETPPPGLLPGDTLQVPRRRALGWGSVLRGLYEVAVVASTIAVLVQRTNP